MSLLTSSSPLRGNAPVYQGMLALGFHIFLLFTAFSVFHFLGFIDRFPLPENLKNWDAGWYRSIAENGYSFVPGQQSNVAFFPFFPYLWRFTQLGLRGISLLNALIFFGALLFMVREFNIKVRELLLFVSLPTLMFMFLPYTEATFFMFAAVFLVGLKRNSLVLILVGLYLSCITRSATLLFVPAIIFMEMMDNSPGKTVGKKVVNAVMYLGTVFLALLTVAYIQWYQTGELFPFFGVHEHWGHVLRLPDFPLTTWGGYRLLWLDGVALWVGLMAGCFCSWLLIKTVLKSQSPLLANRAFVFSAGYLIGSAFFVLLFQGGSIILHRYIFSTPFFLVFFVSLYYSGTVKADGLNRTWMLVAAGTLVFWLFLGAHTRLDGMTHLKTIWYFLLLTFYIMAHAFIRRPAIGTHVVAVLYFLNLICQLYLLNTFLKGEWAG